MDMDMNKAQAVAKLAELEDRQLQEFIQHLEIVFALQLKLAEAESETIRIKSINTSLVTKCNIYVIENARLEEHLTECQAVIKVKNIALGLMISEAQDWNYGFKIADDAFAIKPSTEALDAACKEYAAKVLEAMVDISTTWYEGDILAYETKLRSGEWNPVK